MKQPVVCDVREGVAHLILNEPARGNPLDVALAQGLASCLDRLEHDGGVRAVLVRAEGQNFSFGGDVRFFASELPALDAAFDRLFAALNPALARLQALPVPVVSAVQGWCVGGGLGLAAQADVVVAAESARFGAAFAGVGLSNDSGTTFALASRLGVARARRFFLLNETWDAEAARASGLVDAVVPDDQLDAEAQAVVTRLAAGPTAAFAGMKRNFAEVGGQTFAEALATEAATMAEVTRSADAAEAVAAFVEKRPAVLRGR